MKIEHIVSTMKRKNVDFLKDKNYMMNSVVINQTNVSKKEKFYINNTKSIMYSYKELGLSKSRNRGIEKSSADICIVSDDDIEYVNDIPKIIEQSYNDNLEADIIVFQVEENSGELYKNYLKKKKYINFIEAMRVSSVEMTFKKESLIKKNIKFNEEFGAGAKFFMGEENILLAEALRKGLKILYIPKVIGRLQESESTWFKGYNDEYFISRGASFKGMSHNYATVLILQFALRKYKIYKKDMTFTKACKLMFLGRKIYNNLLRKKVSI